jgi:hypothetical protein
MTGKEAFSAEEWEVLRMSPLEMGELVAKADGDADRGEVEAFRRDVFAEAARHPDALVRAVLTSLEEDAATGLLAAHFPSFVEGKLAMLARVAAILDERCTRDEARHFKAALLAIGLHVAQASGGRLAPPGQTVSATESGYLARAAEALGATELLTELTAGSAAY